MSFCKTTLLFSLLIIALYSQSANLDNAKYYTVQNQTYLNVYGTGSQADSTLGVRDTNAVQAGAQVNTYTPPSAGPAPVQVTCPYNQVYDNILCQCVCIIGYHFEGSSCVANGNPQATCGKNQVYQDKRCACAQGFYLIGSACDVCPPYSAYDLSTLSCPCVPGYTLVNGNCVLPYNPPQPSPLPTPPTCSINQKLVNNICVCIEGFNLIKGVCTYCAAPNYFDTQLAICRPTCKTN
jgi:hypothetical protein